MNRIQLVIFDLDDTLCDTSGQIEPAEQGVDRIKLFPGVTDLIEGIRRRGARAVVVSTGDRRLQESKIEFLGLRSRVDAVLICDLPEEKLALFKQCLREFDAPPHETLVVGDRIDREIRFGKTLHCITVRVLQGKHCGMIPTGESEIADFSIQNIAALRRWFDS